MAKARFITTINGIYLGNMYDPLDMENQWPKSYLDDGESELQSRARTARWLRSKTIGPPVATPEMELLDLRAEGMIGVYFNPDRGDEIRSAEEVSMSLPGGRTDVEMLGETIAELYHERGFWPEEFDDEEEE